MSKLKMLIAVIVVAAPWIGASPAEAHFRLLAPASWLNEGDDGSPQKGGPCGPNGYDNVSPIPATGKPPTTFHAGESIDIEAQETVHHPGYFRVSLAETTAADATMATNAMMFFPDPPLQDTNQCSFDLDAVPTGAHDTVLADGLFKDTDTNVLDLRDLKQKVTLPNKPCDHCTLQVVQVMMDHGGSSCFYYHCADITILAAGDNADAGVDAGASGGGTGGASGTGGMGAAGTSGMSGSSGSGGKQAPPETGTGGSTAASGSGGSAAAAGSGSGAAPAGSGGSAAATGSGGASGVAGTGAGATMPTEGSKKSGCSVAQPGAGANGFASIAVALGLASAAARKRRRRAA